MDVRSGLLQRDLFGQMAFDAAGNLMDYSLTAAARTGKVRPLPVRRFQQCAADAGQPLDVAANPAHFLL